MRWYTGLKLVWKPDCKPDFQTSKVLLTARKRKFWLKIACCTGIDTLCPI